MHSNVKIRRRFFERSKKPPQALRITLRDIALLQNIARFRLVSSSQPVHLCFGYRAMVKSKPPPSFKDVVG